MSDLSSDARALLNRTKAVGEPDEASIARVRGRLLRRVAAGAAVVGTTAGTTTLAAGSVSSVGLVAKGIGIMVVVGMGVVGGYAVLTPAKAPVPALLPKTGLVQTAVAFSKSIPTQDAVAPSSPEAISETERAPSLEQPRVLAKVQSGEGGHLPSPRPTDSSGRQTPALMQDVANLRESQTALVGGDPRRALEAAERVRGDGQLAEQREGLRVLARCALASSEPSTQGDLLDVAQREAGEFLRRWPDSSLAARIRSACGSGH